MMKINIRLNEHEYEEFIEFLEIATYCDLPEINGGMAELILKKIEDEKDW